MNYTLVDRDGALVGSGDCQDIDAQYLVAPEGGQVLLNQTPPNDLLRRWRWDGQAFVDGGLRFPPTYATERQEAYPPVTEQLDLLWHAMDAGTTMPIEPWFSTIKSIKDAYPKP